MKALSWSFNQSSLSCYLVDYWVYNKLNKHVLKHCDLITINGGRAVTKVTLGHIVYRLAHSRCSVGSYDMCDILNERGLK